MRILSLPSFQGEEAASRPATGHTGKEGTLRRHGALTRPEPPSWGSDLRPGLGEELRKVPGTSLQVDSSKKLPSRLWSYFQPRLETSVNCQVTFYLKCGLQGRGGGPVALRGSRALSVSPSWALSVSFGLAHPWCWGCWGLWPLVPLPRWKPFPSREFSGKEP